METLKIGVREFRDKLATYLLESEAPLAITRHGDTIGYFIPARRTRSETETSSSPGGCCPVAGDPCSEGSLRRRGSDGF